ncbi:uncharacterized protein LOC115771323 [Drosophila novamexicana]|uniref:uncharacterized protein LOC115771323 n=1 Tax=Drosophila novamexicana TaxID=47314 RepID=UPI0011E5CDB7|nr:uncharacterized protein LOC115771323 [Drosophila novamexicana]
MLLALAPLAIAQKAARVEEFNKDLDGNAVTPKPGTDGGFYDVVDVLAATSAGVGRPKSGQTTRIYTTGDVNDAFWLKHLGDDFKHAIHLQVGGTNDDYNRIINQTTNGVHEEVHHEYLPGAERPGRERYRPQSAPSGPSFISSSEDTLHTSQSQAAPTSAMSPSSSGSRHDDLDRQLPFKSAFNDYGSRPTRDLTYLLYKRGL